MRNENYKIRHRTS